MNSKLLFSTAGLMIILLALGCQPFERTEKKLSEDPIFFDLNNYFEAEAQRLSAVDQIQKKVTIDQETEVQTVDHPDWEKAFRIFTQSDINKTAWSDKYRADTAFHADRSIASIHYQAMDEDLKTREIKVDFEQDQAFQLYILNEVTNPILTSRQELKYRRDQGYRVESWQKQSLAAERKLLIEVTFPE